MLKLMAVSTLLRRVRESPESRRRRLNPNTEEETATETETESESESATDSELESEASPIEAQRGRSAMVANDHSDSQLDTGLRPTSKSCAAEVSTLPPAAESVAPTRRPKTARVRRTPPGADGAGGAPADGVSGAPAHRQPPARPGSWWPQLSAGRLIGLAMAAVLLATVTVHSFNQLRQDQLLHRPRLTYGQWLARREANVTEPAVLLGTRRLRFNTTAPVHVRWPDHDTCRHHVVRQYCWCRTHTLSLLEGRGADGESESVADFSSNKWLQFVTLRMKQWNFQTQLAVDLAEDLLVVYLEELRVSLVRREEGLNLIRIQTRGYLGESGTHWMS
ncbi:hypothetical protein FJT64_025611 [Amphibalanus amphitrite]|uniref:Uncharacterized protein n=1 Tax=Amphibalanus amphitrite TaxID=1232801 RepID=A0A6A4W8G0_AMPAM|nr:hypothetical protein FJT64_025611 [Amphibalanus amphitrite]